MLLKLAWRNLWRQKRRTLLTASALALALLLSLLMRSFQEGGYNANIESVARLSTGLIQLQHPEFKDSQSIDDLLPATAEFIQFTKNQHHIETVLPRIESFALAASENKSKGILLFGIDADAENNYSSLADKIVEGRYLTDTTSQLEHNPVIIAEGVAQKLNLKLGDELVLYGQGYRGQTAAGLFTIQGILHFPMPALNNRMVYMNLKDAQQFYSTGDLVTSWVLHSDKFENIPFIVETLKKHYTKQVNVRGWADLNPESAQQITVDRVSGIFIMYLLYAIVGFGLFATLLMMTLERQREFAVMLATGLLRCRLLHLIIIESLLIGVLGIAIGLAFALPVLLWFLFNPITLTGETATMMLEMGYDPILPVLFSTQLFIDQIMIVLSLLAVCLIYPLWRLYRLDLVSALKGGAHAN
ncbi:MAG: ABC transporter permease [Psychromonas sp.]|nr:ABC transporter permease [Psychromonas sp.]